MIIKSDHVVDVVALIFKAFYFSIIENLKQFRAEQTVQLHNILLSIRCSHVRHTIPSILYPEITSKDS